MTSLIVELLVVGIGTIAWLLLLVMTLFGYDWIPVADLDSGVAVLMLAALAYLFGIILDRFADFVFAKPAAALKEAADFESSEAYEESKELVYVQSALRDVIEYSRSRIRICRGWSINSLLLLIASNCFVWVRLPDDAPRARLSGFLTLGFAVIAATTVAAWRDLSSTAYRRTRKQAQVLKASATGTMLGNS